MADSTLINQIITPTSRWQITIPKKIRKRVGLKERKPFNITVDKGKIVMVPIKAFIEEDFWDEERRKKLLKALKEIRGIWAKDWPEIKKKLEKQRKKDLKEIEKLRKY